MLVTTYQVIHYGMVQFIITRPHSSPAAQVPLFKVAWAALVGESEYAAPAVRKLALKLSYHATVLILQIVVNVSASQSSSSLGT